VIEVVNKKVYKGDGEYIGRPSALGNPYAVGKNAFGKIRTREEAIEEYKTWFLGMLLVPTYNNVKGEFMRLVEIYKETGNLILICWCVPLPCHGDYLKEQILEICK